jgi:response regulator RpfG family c-di-GMP phosphodiesterase
MNDDAHTQISKVLLVDDEENILNAITRLLLEDDDLEVLTAVSGEKGLELLRQHSDVAVILSDQRMPGMNGAEFLHQARSIAPEAIRMILTGYADINAATDAINKGGASRYISKPWDDEMLAQAIRDGVNHYRLIEENRRLTAVVKQQNEELQEWNANLKSRVMEQTAVIRKQNDDLAVRNARIQEAFNGTIAAFSRLFELCSPTLHSHAKNVAELAVGTAKHLQLDTAEIETIRIAALLHDIGVIGIPEQILVKKNLDMTPEERTIFQQHSVRGQTAIDAVEALRQAGLLIRHHHEHYNGKGYPDGLTQDEIPLGARIIGFADYVDREMAGRRGEQVLESVLQMAMLQLGTVLDPKLITGIKNSAKYLYFKLETRTPGIENEYSPLELVSGMEVTRDIYSGTGLLLINKGVTLDRQMIESIQRYYEIDPPKKRIYAIIPKRGAGA